MDLVSGLNEAQKKAVLSKEGPLLIIAGAGAGKTKTLTHRIAHLVATGVRPENILAITFTNKAAKEMKERVEGLLASSSPHRMPLVCTFHSFGVRLLREYGENIGLSRSFSITDDSESMSYIKSAIKQLSLDPKKYEPRKIKSVISKEKGSSVTHTEYKQNVSSAFGEVVSAVWRIYEESLTRDHALDFDDLLLKAKKILVEFPAIREQLRSQYTYIHVDEYQDTNDLQYEIIRMLVGEAHNICVVGDSDQNIYSWRGANIKNILSFEEDYPGADVVVLEENYRSTNTILTAANEIIKKNTMRKDKNLFTQKAGGEMISLIECLDERSEADYIAGKIIELLDKGISDADIAVLFRANFQSRALEDAMIRFNVPYHVLGTRFFDRKEVKDIMSYIYAAQNRSSEKDIRRSISVPKRGIGEKTIDKLFTNESDLIPAKTAEKIRFYFDFLDDIKEKIETLPPSELLKYIVVNSGIEAMLLEGSDEDKERLENIRELVTVAKEYDGEESGLMGFLDTISLASDQDSIRKEKKGVILMTVHASKGLEFGHVFITGLEQDLFPHTHFGDKKTKEEKEEERRLMYVAVTRAKDKLYLTYASQRTIYGQREMHIPSEFISDIPDTLFEFEYNLTSSSGGGERFIYLDPF